MEAAEGEEKNILDDSGLSEETDEDPVETESAVGPPPTDGVLQPGASNDDAVPPGEDAHDFEESLDITALEATTSAHDDWLHRGPFLFDMDFHTYMRFTIRKPIPKEIKVSQACSGGFIAQVFYPRARKCFIPGCFGRSLDRDLKIRKSAISSLQL